MSNIRICQVDTAYLDFLRQYDYRVSTNPTGTRKFIGVLLEVVGHQYYAPLSSPKPKHAKISSKALDVHKINDGRFGIINLNNMVPVPDIALLNYDIESELDSKYKSLLLNQMEYIQSSEAEIIRKASALYRIITEGTASPCLIQRCCQYHVLEKQVLAYLNQR